MRGTMLRVAVACKESSASTLSVTINGSGCFAIVGLSVQRLFPIGFYILVADASALKSVGA
jgi:hypothetical protein